MIQSSRGDPDTRQNKRPISMSFTAYLALQEELRLTTIQRKKAADEIEWLLLDGRAPDDPLVLALRAKMARLEASVAELESLLRRAVIVEDEDESIRVRIGSTVEVSNLATGAVMRYTVVSPSEAEPRAGRISSAAPVGAALLGRCEGEEFEVQVPAGKLRLRVERIE